MNGSLQLVKQFAACLRQDGFWMGLPGQPGGSEQPHFELHLDFSSPGKSKGIIDG